MTPSTLGDWLAYLEQLHPSAIDMGLDRSRKVAQQLGLTRPAPRVITVTGTNGKGSTCAFVASLLQAQGLKVGVYSSPHLLRYNERVKVQGVEATDLELCDAFAAVESARGDVTLTYFEMGTLAAFWLFEQAQLDAVVLEVGLGGRLDAVNLIDADLALVTSIGVDHADWLGDTRESVAFEKAGIFRAGRPALCGDLDPPEPLLAKARELGCPLLLRGQDFDLSVGPQGWDWRGIAHGELVELRDLPLLDLPMQNAALALQAFALLGYPLNHQIVSEALAQTRLVGRLDRRTVHWQGRALTLLLDVGHNPHAAQFLAHRMAQRPVVGKRLAVFGLLSDKDLDGVVHELASSIQDWAVAPLPTSRSRPAAELQVALENLGARVKSYQSIASALEAQCAHATPDDEILLFGSFYCVAEALDWLARHTDEDAANGFAG
ncbi:MULTISPECIES: bifunctional tetrahydrofolate synthase/dihydrofolate synthase [Pseudomonas syringae group]|uniref:Dihydrofolate synthase/folylpolyglutamate synthase n=1 Tax=Pseudomonas viridiflava TaxID=33069 RepID=A0A1Y6JQF1_PSEVI|nr:bifunctional tetrahydrofolate synthase/dihydrofolate synthase [Pseudomonas viridiflava]MCF8981113.1 bifunctional tetrahydrofolate synthase/dihydrofolate synthase [Pseudomonas syringae]VVN64581.1 Dihydrofolate synthase/folylpolyglutamate synthase [Pseudomonas fluorescens]MBV1809015.1 bifunctional tetrahydrofolate synthase/dihydrofolate synthase [Pseudomonas viridiflava]MEE4088966.1 bifunctional tetrahydrofolate synthase/dihydrofolate synthase [Pseudomonas viridiflava]MEE4133825.1 bifunctiona